MILNEVCQTNVELYRYEIAELDFLWRHGKLMTSWTSYDIMILWASMVFHLKEFEDYILHRQYGQDSIFNTM